MSQITIESLTKSYPTRSEPLEILRGIDLSLGAGENAAIVGPSGSGKSTLLHIAGTLDSPTTGTVSIAGTDPFALDAKGLARFRNENIGFVFQEHYLLPQLSVLENVLLPTLAFGKSTAEQVKRANGLIERVGLGKRLQHRPAELSGGERQRVALARALIEKPLLVLADEPTGSLDQSNAAGVGELLLEMNEAEKTILMVVTHSMELASRFQQVYRLDAGKLEVEKNASPSTPV